MNGILESIIKEGTHILQNAAPGAHMTFKPNVILCADGFHVSVIAGYGTYCEPRPGMAGVPMTFSGPFTHLEVGFPSERPEPWLDGGSFCWAKYADDGQRPDGTVYPYVPVSMVLALIANHGGAISVFSSTQDMLLAMADRKIVRKRRR